MNTEIPLYNVSELTFLIKSTLEGQFPVIKVEGEISGFKPASSGHCYFNLKDGQSVISAVLFRQQRMNLSFNPCDGQKTTVLARLSVYPPRGNYQLICESMELKGEGDILRQLELLKQKLAAQGLFAPDRKKPLPPWPERIAVVSSAHGAALQDIIHVLRRRMPRFHLLVKDVLVQGEQSAASITKALNQLYKRNDLDVIILARGGGSLEDLLSFSHETVVRTVAASPVPLICGVGHEIDFSLSDFAADVRAATPSAAAEIVSAHYQDIQKQLKDLKMTLLNTISHNTERQKWRLASCGHSVLKASLLENIHQRQQRIDQWQLEIPQYLNDRLGLWKQKTALAREVLESASPENILARGFSLIYKDNNLVFTASSLKQKDQVSIRFKDGEKQALILEDR